MWGVAASRASPLSPYAGRPWTSRKSPVDARRKVRTRDGILVSEVVGLSHVQGAMIASRYQISSNRLPAMLPFSWLVKGWYLSN